MSRNRTKKRWETTKSHDPLSDVELTKTSAGNPAVKLNVQRKDGHKQRYTYALDDPRLKAFFKSSKPKKKKKSKTITPIKKTTTSRIKSVKPY